jgi:hypothetical protein
MIEKSYHLTRRKKMTYEQNFLNDLGVWLDQQVQVMAHAMKTAEQMARLDKENTDARDAVLRYESRLDAYTYLLGKMNNYSAGKNFHDLPDGLLEKKVY